MSVIKFGLHPVSRTNYLNSFNPDVHMAKIERGWVSNLESIDSSKGKLTTVGIQRAVSITGVIQGVGEVRPCLGFILS